MDLNDLDNKLGNERAEDPSSRMIGYFSAASCITGVLADDVATTLLLTQYGALSIWDYTLAGERKEKINLQVVYNFLNEIRYLIQFDEFFFLDFPYTVFPYKIRLPLFLQDS